VAVGISSCGVLLRFAEGGADGSADFPDDGGAGAHRSTVATGVDHSLAVGGV